MNSSILIRLFALQFWNELARIQEKPAQEVKDNAYRNLERVLVLTRAKLNCTEGMWIVDFKYFIYLHARKPLRVTARVFSS